MSEHDDEFIRVAIDAAALCSSEDGAARPMVGAALVKADRLLATAHRGELKPGEHAEYTLLQRKLLDQDLAGTTLFTTLEPCTSRNDPKRPCAEWIVERGIQRVVVGMLDPNPVVYERGASVLRAAGLGVDFFPGEWRETVRAQNEAFIAQYHASPGLCGTVSFNYQHNNGFYSIGNGDLSFRTHWSNAGASSIHTYTDGTNLQLGLVTGALGDFNEIRDAGAYDMSSRARTPQEGEFVVMRNNLGYFAALRVDDVRARSHGDDYDAVTITYRINPDGGPLFVA